MIFHMHVKSCHVKDKWKECEKVCEKCYPFHTVISHTLQTSSHTRFGSKHVKKHDCEILCERHLFSHAIHVHFTLISHDNFTFMWNFAMWKGCEKHVKILNCSPVSHGFSHALSDVFMPCDYNICRQNSHTFHLFTMWKECEKHVKMLKCWVSFSRSLYMLCWGTPVAH